MIPANFLWWPVWGLGASYVDHLLNQGRGHVKDRSLLLAIRGQITADDKFLMVRGYLRWIPCDYAVLGYIAPLSQAEPLKSLEKLKMLLARPSNRGAALAFRRAAAASGFFIAGRFRVRVVRVGGGFCRLEFLGRALFRRNGLPGTFRLLGCRCFGSGLRLTHVFHDEIIVFGKGGMGHSRLRFPVP